jgi:hypothetical protein
MDRRAFIKLTAISGGTATLASCGNPEHQLIRFIPDEDLVPGVAQWKPGICPACPAGCGLHVRVMEADAEVTRNGQPGVIRMNVAKKLEGNPAHPINHGGLCPRGQASIQITYHPDRIASPQKRAGPRGSGRFEPVSWDAAIDELVTQLDTLASRGQQRALAFLTTRRPGVRHQVVVRLLRSFGAPPPVVFDVFSDDVLRLANLRSFGREQLPTFDLARSVRHRLRCGLPRHVELAVPTRGPSARCVRADRVFVADSSRSNRACRRPAPMPMSGCRSDRAPRGSSR